MRLLCSKAFPEQTFDACLGVLRLQKGYGTTRLETACGIALQTPRMSYRLINNIMENNRDKIQQVNQEHAPMLPFHGNIRGKEVYR